MLSPNQDPSDRRLRPAPQRSSPLPSGRVCVLLNANAKQVDDRCIASFARHFSSEQLFVSRTADDALRCARLAIARGDRAVLVGGGDGSIANFLNGLAQVAAEREFREATVPAIGILKLGTGNALASVVDAGRPLDDALWFQNGGGGTRPLRMLVDDETNTLFPFGSVGHDAAALNDYEAMVHATGSRWGRRLAKSLVGYLYAIGTRTLPAQLSRPAPWVRVFTGGMASILDPETSEEIPLERGATLFEGSARAIVMGTTPCYGFGMRVIPFAERRTDRFHLRVSTASVGYLLRHLRPFWRGTLRTDRFVDFLVEDARVELSEPTPAQLSGDAAGHRRRWSVRLADTRFRVLTRSCAASDRRSTLYAPPDAPPHCGR